MAQQESIIKLKGKIGDLTFYKTRDGYQAREAKGIDPSRIANDPKFQRTRENSVEFGTAGSAAKRMRNVLRAVIVQHADVRMANRLTSRMLRLVKADAENERGERRVLAANTPMLKGFSFNTAAQLDSTFITRYTYGIDRVTGAVTVSVPAFDAAAAVVSPKGATHFQLTLAALAMDFTSEADPILLTAESEELGVKALVEATELSVELPEAIEAPIFLVFGVGFYQEVNGRHYPLQNGVFNALSIIEVSSE